MSHYISGAIEFESYRAMKEQLDIDRDFIRSELAKLTVDEIDSREAVISPVEVIKKFHENWAKLTGTEKRLFLTNYIKKIFVKSELIKGSTRHRAVITNVEFNTY